ncbi:metalloendopeptidase-like membrane protein [Leptolyngbyaceae cyanobacterium JSC-12]|nr:metalloendopeptidase-like membrane protein [Leptolyngbyaceae cyanobacterium JSC-12]
MNWQMNPSTLFSGRLRRSLLISSISLASVLGVMGNRVLLAQTPNIIDATPIESAPIEPEIPAIPAAPEPVYVPAPIEVVPPAASAPSNDAYIDSTDYSVGATQRTRDLSAPSVNIGGIQPPSFPSSMSVGGITPPSVSWVGTTPSLKDFYRRTLRPPGRLGNGNIRLIFPLSIPAPITSLFGWRIHPIFGTPRFHAGTDIGAPIGTPVLAAYAGQVAMADFLGGYGLAVALNHNQGKQQTLYGHLSEVFVKAGELVKQGAVIGRVGSTGNSTGPHLHFEYRELTADGWVALDPGAQLEYALAELVKTMEISEKGIAGATGLQVSQRGIAGVSGEIAWNAPFQQEDAKQSSQKNVVR